MLVTLGEQLILWWSTGDLENLEASQDAEHKAALLYIYTQMHTSLLGHSKKAWRRNPKVCV